MIGGIFNPSLLRPRDFKVALGFSSRPSQAGLTSGASSTTGEEKEKDGQKGVEKKGKGKKGSKTVELNTAAVIAEIGRLGTGLVSKVELRNAA